MSDSGLSVKFTADVTDLQAKAAVAKVAVTGYQSAVKSAAVEVASASEDMKSAAMAALQQQVTLLDAAKAKWQEYQAQVVKATEESAVSQNIFASLGQGATAAATDLEEMTDKFGAVSRLTSAISEFVIAGLGIEIVSETINHVAEAGEQLEKLSQETGLTTEQLSGLKTMAAETGTDFDQFATLLQRLPNTMQEAAINPAGKAAEAFQAMGIQVTDTATGQLRPMGDILDEVSAKLASYSEGADKTALETDIFGAKIGANLLPMLNQLGQVGLQGAIVQSKLLNQTWTQSTAEAAEQFEEDMGRAKQAVQGIEDAIVRGLLPALDMLANHLAPTLDAQIADMQGEVNELGVRATAGMKQQLAELQAQKAEIDKSIQQQSASAGGAAPGTVQAPTISASSNTADWLKQQSDALTQENAQIEQNASSTKQANEEKLQNTVQYWQSVLQAGNLTNAEELAAQTALSKAEMGLKQQQLSAGTAADKSAANSDTEIATESLDTQITVAKNLYDQKVETWDAEVSAKQITKEQEVQLEVQAANAEYATEMKLTEQKAALYTKGTEDYAKALDDEVTLTSEHDDALAKLNADLAAAQAEDLQKSLDAQKAAAEATQKAWTDAFAPIGRAFDESINGVLQGTQTLQQAELKAAQSITLAFIDAEAKKVENFLAGEAAILAANLRTELGINAAKVSGAAEGRSIDAASAGSSILVDAHQAAAGAYAAIAGIPYIGPVLAPVAAATAYAAVLAFDVLSAEGGLAVPAGVNPLVQLHENETVLPAHIAQPLQNLAEGNDDDAGGGAGGSTSLTLAPTINVSGANMNSNEFQTAVMNALNNTVRSGALSKYPAIERALRRSSS